MEGKVIKQKLLELNVTQLDLAGKLGTTPQSLSSVLHAKDVRSGTIEKIAQVLGVPISYLYGEGTVNQNAVANGNKSVAAINSNVDARDSEILKERVKALESIVAEKERLINVLPLHHTQRVLVDDGKVFKISVHVKITNDFVMALLSRSRSLEVIAPMHLRKRMMDVYREALVRNSVPNDMFNNNNVESNK